MNRLRRGVLIALSALAATMGLTGGASAATADQQLWHPIKNKETGRCLAIKAADNWNGSPAFQFDCRDEWLDQKWVIEPNPDGRSSRIENKKTHRCLAIKAADNYNGSPAFQFDCNPNYADQRWELVRLADGSRLIVNMATRRCLAVKAANNWNGAPAFQFDCNVHWGDQRWNIIGLG